MKVKINIENYTAENIFQISENLKNGKISLLPTDTIYGLSCNMFNEIAIQKIFELKNRDSSKPFLVLANSIEMIDSIIENIPPIAKKLIENFYQKSITIIFKSKKNVSKILTSNTNKIGVRIPNSKFCLDIISKTNFPIVSTSANISGKKIFSHKKMIETFQKKVDLIVDVGTLQNNPSTIVDVSTDKIEIIREGTISIGEIKNLILL